MKIIIDDIDVLDGYNEKLDIEVWRNFFKNCLPCNDEKLYRVSGDGETYKWVPESELYLYTFVKINVSRDGEYSHSNVSEQGISLLAFDVDDPNKFESQLPLCPSFVTQRYDTLKGETYGKAQIVFLLKNFVPTKDKKGKRMDEQMWRYLEKITDYFEDHIGYYTDELINPLSESLAVYVLNEKGTSLRDMNSACFPETPERAKYRKCQFAKGAEIAAGKKRQKTFELLKAAIISLKSRGERITKRAIARQAGCSPPTVYDYWPRLKLLCA